jgi:hypothetical protein
MDRSIGVGADTNTTKVLLPFVALSVKTLKKVGVQSVFAPGKVVGSIPRQQQAEST